MSNSLILPLIAIFGVSLLSGLLGCFVLWRKMAYFGDALTHSSLFAITLGLILGLKSPILVIIFSCFFAVTFIYLKHKSLLPNDSILAVISYSFIAISLMLLHIFNQEEIEIHEILFGDIMQVSLQNIYIIYLLIPISYVIIALNWSKLILLTINSDLASSYGINKVGLELIITVLLAITISVTIQIIGLLLIMSLFIIPSIIAKQFAQNPKQMVIFSTICNAASVMVATPIAYYTGTPPGATIVIANLIILLLTLILQQYKKQSLKSMQ